jgi:alpha-beta hydrolase superfamily lysophospholipase
MHITSPLKVLRRHWPWTALLAAALVAGCASLEVEQRKLIFRPSSTQPQIQPRAQGMDDVWIEHQSAETGKPVKLHALWVAHSDPQAPVMLYLHGARRTVEGSAFRIRHMHELGFAILAVDYRGFGQSTEELPSEAMAYEDARATWAWIVRNHPESDRYIYGHSLGGAIAVQLATEVTDSKGLIVEGTFTSIVEVFQSFKWGWLPLTPLITQRFDSASKIGNVKMPVLVVHGSSDQVIAPELGRALYERASAPKRFVLVDGGTHYNTIALALPQYREALRELFGLVARSEQQVMLQLPATL